MNGQPWDLVEFRQAAFGKDWERDNSRKGMANWRGEYSAPEPTTAELIKKALFGINPAFDQWREDYDTIYKRSKGPGNNKRTRKPPTPPPVALARASVPRLAQHFMGRDADLHKLVTAFDTGDRAILVEGGPGMGKTELTKAAAFHKSIIEKFEGRRWFVSLDAATTAATMQDAIARALGFDLKQGFQAILHTLHGKQTLLILDNLETPWERAEEREATEAVLADLYEIEGLSLLGSFRGRGGAGDIWERRNLKGLPYDTSRKLFAAVAGEWVLDDRHLDDFVDALGGIPLAIDLVARRAQGRELLQPLWEEWLARGTELAKRPDFPAQRLTSLFRSIDLSLQSSRITDASKHLFSVLGILPAGLCAEDRNALIGDDGFEAEETLHRAGLAFLEDSRVDLLPPIRDFATRHYALERQDSINWTRYFLTLTKTVGALVDAAPGEGAFSRLYNEFSNIEAAILTAIGLDLGQEALDVLPEFRRLTYIGSLATTMFSSLAAVCAKDQDLEGEANCIKGQGDIALVRSDHGSARHAYEKALQLYQKSSSARGEAECIKSLGELALVRSDHATALAAFEEAQPIFRRIGDVRGEASCIEAKANIAYQRSDYENAQAAFEEGLPLFRKIGSSFGEATCIFGLGNIALERSDHETARASYEQARSLFREVGSLAGAANCVKNLGRIALERSDHAEARAMFEEALPLYQRAGSVVGEASCIVNLAHIALERSDHASAQAGYEEALPLYRQMGSILGEANCVAGLGTIAFHHSNYAAAREAHQEALLLYREMGSVLGEANSIRHLADIARHFLNDDEARSRYEAALALHRQVGDIYGAEICIKSLAEMGTAQ